MTMLLVSLVVSYACIAGAFLLLQYPYRRFYRRHFPHLGLVGIAVFWLPFLLFMGLSLLFARLTLAAFRLVGLKNQA